MNIHSKTLSEIQKYYEGKNTSQCCAYHSNPQDKDFGTKMQDDKIVSCYACAYGVYFMALRATNLGEGEKAQWQRFWLKHCISPETHYIFEVLKEVEVDREGSVREIAQDNLLELDGPLAKAIPSERGKEYYRTVLVDWFLKRYNWNDAFLIHHKMKESCLSTMIIVLVIILPVLILFFLMIGDINLNPKLISNPFLMTAYQFSGKPASNSDPGIGNLVEGSILSISVYIAYGASSILLMLLFIGLLFSKKYAALIFPRLLGANVIGILPLLTQDNMWRLPLRLNWGQICFFSTVSFMAAVIYLAVECRKTTFLSGWWTLLKRVVPVSLYSLLIGISLSLVFCDVLAYHFIEYDKIIYGTSYAGLFGLIYPKIVVLFGFSSLLIGIFVQVFWEEKTVTEPL